MINTTTTSDPERHSQQFKAKVTKLASSPQKNHLNLDKKPLPMPAGHFDNDDDVFTHEFPRNDVRGLIHSITQELKIKGVKTPLVLLAFRPKADDHKLSEFLATVIPNGTNPAKQAVIDKVVKNTDEFTLVAALKYLWARLPMSCVIGWDSYDSFKKLEERDNYPEKAFLEFMPQCLSSPSHASIVYDFLDLIVSFAANSKENQLSGRKIAKMAGIWAFHGPQDTINLTKSRLDPTENTFVDGLRDWLPAADAMFHLLLSFLRSMLPEDRSTKLQLPRTLQALLASNLYPPPDLTYSSSTLVNVPLVTIKTNIMSGSPVEMLNRVPKILTFDNPDMFEAKEDFALLKSLCRSDDNILNKLSLESRRIVEAMCQKPRDSALKPGWPDYRTPSKMRDPHTEVIISRVSLDDYFIWSWLASMSFEETVTKKKLFGRALISEVVFDGFKKWIIVEEQNTYANVRNHQPPLPEKPKVRKVTQPNYTSMLDGLPQEQPSKNARAKKKEKSLPPATQIPVPMNSSRQQRVESGASKKLTGLLNPLKKLQNNHAEPLPAPVPRARAPVVRESTYHPPEQIEPLPEIQTNQYRLSIPLDSFGFDTTDQSIEQNGNGYDYDNQNQHQYQYQSLAPQSQSAYLNNNGYNGTENDYNYWSSAPRKSLAPPQNNRNSSYEIEQVITSMDQGAIPVPPQPQFGETGRQDSIENLSSMVDHMTLQVGAVENKLGNKSAPMWDVEVPLPQDGYGYSEQTSQQPHMNQYNVPVHQSEYQDTAPRMEYHDPVQQFAAQSSMPDTSSQMPRRKPPTPNEDVENESATGSSVYGPTPTATNTPSFPSQERYAKPTVQNIPGTDYPSDNRGYMKPEETPQIQIPHPKTQDQKSYQGQQVLPVAMNNQTSMYQPQRSMVDVIDDQHQHNATENSETYGNFEDDTPAQQLPQDQRYSRATTAHESFYSTETLQRGETPYTDASEMKSPSRLSPDVTTEDPTINSKRSSNKYPESIIDAYQLSTTSSPQRRSEHPSPERSKKMDAMTAAAMRASMPLSVSDVQYIPEPELEGVPVPAPIPKSPFAGKRLPPSPGKVDNTSLAAIETIPQLNSSYDVGSQSLPAQTAYVTSGQPPYQEEQQSIPQSITETFQPEPPRTQQRPQRKAPIASPVRDTQVRLSAENLAPPQNDTAVYEQQYSSQDQSYVPSSQVHLHTNQHYSHGVPPQQYSAQQLDHRQTSPNRVGSSPAVTPQKHNQYEGNQYRRDASPVDRNQGGAYAAVTPNRHQNFAPPTQGAQRTSPSNNNGSRGGSPFYQQGGAQQGPRYDGRMNPALRNGNGPYNPSSHNGGGSPIPGPHNAPTQQVPVNGRSPVPGPYARNSNHSPASTRSGPPAGQGRDRSPQHGGPPQQGHYHSPRGQYHPQSYPPEGQPQSHQPQGYPPQGYPQQSHPPQTHSPQNYPPQSYPPQNYPPQNYPPHNYPPQTYPPHNYPPQNYPPQNYPPQNYPPQGYPPQGYPAQGYPPQGYYPPPQGPGSVGSKVASKPSASDMALQSIPASVGMNKLHHRPANKMDKKNMRNALTQGDFGI